MPEAATIEAPPASVGSAVPPSTGEIHVTAPTTPPNQQSTPPRKRAMDRLFSDLEKKAGAPPEPPPKPAAAPPTEPTKASEPAPKDKTAAPAETPPETPPETPAETPPETPPADAPAEAPATSAEPAKKKLNPWRLYDEEKAKVLTLEKQLAEVKQSPLAEAERTELTAARDAAAKKAQELEDEIRFVNYEKHPEFQEKYQKPYDDAWKAATADLGEIPVTDAGGNERAATPQDLLELIALPLGKARAVADKVFGPFADDIMAARKTVKALFDARQQALADAKTQGAAREKERAEAAVRLANERTSFITKEWDAAQKSVVADKKYGELFTAPPDDKETAAVLDAGLKLVDTAFSRNVADPSLKPEEAADLVRAQASVRWRAAVFDRLVRDREADRAKIAKLEADIAKLNSSTPPTGGSTQPSSGAPATGGRRIDRVFAELDKLAR